MDDPTTFADVAMMATMGLIAIVIVWVVLSTRAKGGVERVKQVELERDEARQRAERLQDRVDRLEERLGRRVDRQLEHEDFDRRLDG